ncbi:protein FAR1-RELATED SEQUENCE 5-like [Lycium ferocissimum]|uniref:protein FAR1-RELATED SEQUENCE 5-like n=1 Tax=Lycium ferocissimum TaxID=112874 RepID=UPI002814CD9F|nr:protein FAR1-RELATED SEQUENCE 5-like [Lycium ferocissimum]
MSENSLMNEHSEFNGSVGSHNGGEDTHVDGQAEDTSAYSGESEEVYSDEQILAGPMTVMFFKSVESVFRFYKRHAKMRGFCVLKRTLSKNYALFVCDNSRKLTNQKHTKRIGCEARVNAAMKRDGSWMVIKVCRDHNHKLDSSLSWQMVGHRYINKSVKRMLEANDRAGLRPCKSVRLLEVQSGGPENMGCTLKDCRNYIEQQGRLQMLGDKG